VSGSASRDRSGLLDRLLSGDRPGSAGLGIVMAVIFIVLAFAPVLFPGTRSVAVASEICIYIVLAASYDVLLGYTGIVSFAHTMFFGMGGYGVAIALAKGWVGWGAVLLGSLAGVALAVVVAAIIGLLSLRVRAIFFSMVTLAVASLALILATQMRDLTGGEDGLTFSVPRELSPAFRLFPDLDAGATVFGKSLSIHLRFDGRFMTYYLVFAVSLVLFLVMLRLVNSPFGRVLQAIRENEFRAEALGYRTIVYRTLAGALSAAMAALAGAMMALSLHYSGPSAMLSFDIMVNILLMVVIGGMGTLYGPALGAVIIVMAKYYLQPAMTMISGAFAGWPVLPQLFHPDRWLLWLGVLFVLIVYFFPAGIVGTFRLRAWARRSPQAARSRQAR
jgi:branched-chain amino acid transport system permease protein